MSVILLVLGILVAGAGLAAIGFGIPINEFTLGTTLIMTGATALTGGLILVGLATVASELNRLGEALRTRPATRAVRPVADAPESEPDFDAAAAPAPAPTVAAPNARPMPPQMPAPPPRPQAAARDLGLSEPRPASPSTVEVSAAAIERLRSSIPRSDRAKPEPGVMADLDEVPLSPNGSALPGHNARPAAADPAPQPARSGETAAVEALKASRLDFLFRSKPAPRPAPSEGFDAFWPADGQPAKSAPREVEPEPRVEPRSEPRLGSPARPAAPAPAKFEERYVAPSAEETSPAAILKSGVVDGMAYTLYADGSIEAKLPHGTVRFGSIAELRAHIESNS